jgi:eukaryotic-like serine/threonine-protein kinase
MESIAEQDERLMSLVTSALAKPQSEREQWLRFACGGDEHLFRDAFEMMQEEERMGTFLLHPMIAFQDFPRPFSVGQAVAERFEITKEIGEGGMGVVYEAFDRKRNLRIAIKSAKPGFQRLLSPELEGALTVRHPNVCRVNEIHTAHTDHGEVDFLTMELLEGETLSAYLKARGKLAESEALPIAQQLCAGLAEAHRSGVIHRDLKSANIILCQPANGELRTVITDFGLAGGATQSDDLAGTPAYMAPELWRGEKTSKASDIYALGVIFYEMVADTSLQGRQGGDPRLPDTSGLSWPWAGTINRCLDADPGARPKDALKVLAGLEKRPYPRRLILAFLLIALLGAVWFWHQRSANILTEKDTIVLADFVNTTGDAIFDDTLKTALNISLRQSPFLNVLSDSQVSKTLKMMTRPADTKLTPEVAGEVCQRAGSIAYLAGSIGSLGNEYVLELKAVSCQNGDTLSQEQVTAASKEKVLGALGKGASKLRGELGESLATVQKFDVPLVQATTSSLEALKAFSLGRKAVNEKGIAAALPYDQRAIELDPNFALGYLAVGNDYNNLGEPGRASEYYTKAFQLREHASDRERLQIAANYYRTVTGELDKGAQSYQEVIESYPRVGGAYDNLGLLFAGLGQYEKAAEITRQGMHVAPPSPAGYANLANYTLALQRFEEVRQIIHEGKARKLDSFVMHNALYALAFLGADSAAMAQQQQWFAGKPEENFGLALASDTEAYGGHLTKARELTKRAVDSAIRADSKESGAIWQAIVAQREAAFGNPAEARQSAAEGLKLAPASQGVESEAALALAMAGDTARAGTLAQDLGKRFPLDTQMQSLWLPAIRAQLALDRKKPALALNALQASSPIELASIPFVNNVSCLYPVYVRGEAYLAAGQGNAAAVEFQRILDHSGIVWNCWTGALAHLGVARANALQARTSQGADADATRVRALAAYKDFFTLWKDADPDIPILKQAKAEYAKLQ